MARTPDNNPGQESHSKWSAKKALVPVLTAATLAVGCSSAVTPVKVDCNGEPKHSEGSAFLVPGQELIIGPRRIKFTGENSVKIDDIPEVEFEDEANGPVIVGAYRIKRDNIYFQQDGVIYEVHHYPKTLASTTGRKVELTADCKGK